LLIDEKLLGPDHVDVGTDLNNLGALYFFRGRSADRPAVIETGARHQRIRPRAQQPAAVTDSRQLHRRSPRAGRNAEAAPLGITRQGVAGVDGHAMNEVTLRKLLEDVRAGRVPSETALKRLKSLSIHDLDFARVDGHRSLRKGFPEVIYCEGKTPTQVVKIAQGDLAP